MMALHVAQAAPSLSKDEVRERLDYARYFEDRLGELKPAAGPERKALCCFHDDERPSLYCNTTTGQYHCKACNASGDVFSLEAHLHGGDFPEVVERLGQFAGIEGPKMPKKDARAEDAHIADQYDYFDADGNYQFTVMRFEEPGCEKTFRQWRKTDSGWIKSLGGVEPVLFNLPCVAQADTVYVCEGEKDAINLGKFAGVTATTAPMGAGKWRAGYTEALRGKHVVVVPDNDGPGRQHAKVVQEALSSVAASVKVVNLPGLPEKGDITDWIDAGGTTEDFARLVDQAPEAKAPEPPFSFSALEPHITSVGRFIDDEPEPIRWTFKDSLPLGSLGFLVSPGGVGKSYFLLQALCAVATDFPSIDGIFTPEERGQVVGIFGEDAEPVLHHRFRAIMHEFSSALTKQSRELALRENMHVISGAGRDMRLIRDVQRNLEPSATYQELGEYLVKIPDLKLVILDPVSRFYAGDENDNASATFFVSLLEGLARETGATIICSHHTSKAASDQQKGYKARLDPSYIRGASALPFGGRWAYMLTTLRQGEAKKLGGEPDPGRYIAAHTAKKNVGQPEGYAFMERGEGGVLRAWEPEITPDATAEDNIEAVVDQVNELCQAGERVTQRVFKMEYAGQINGLGRGKLDETIKAALDMGRLVEVDGKNPKGVKVKYLHPGAF